MRPKDQRSSAITEDGSGFAAVEQARRLSLPVTAFLVIGALLLCNTLVRLALPGVLEADEAEQVFHSQWLLWGYGPQPPLYNWIQIGVFELAGTSIASLSVLKHAILFLCYVFYWCAADAALKDDRLKVVAMFGLLTLPQVTIRPEYDLTHTVLLLSATSLFLYAFFRILKRPDVWGYVVAGIAIGVGFMAKYNFVLLPVAAALAVFPERELRGRILDWRLLLSVVIAGLIVLPHGLWIIHNLDSATAETLEKMNEDGHPWSLLSPMLGLWELLRASVEFSVWMFVAFFALYGKSGWTVLKARSRLTAVTGRMLIVIFIALVLIVLGTGATQVRERWLVPFLLVLPLYLTMKIEAAGAEAKVIRPLAVKILILILLYIPVAFFGRTVRAGLTAEYGKLNTPFDGFTEVLASRDISPGLVVAGDRHLAGNMLLDMPHTPVMTSQYPNYVLPWDKKKPILLVWRTEPDGRMPEEMSAWAAAHGTPGQVTTVELPYHYGRDGDTFGFSYAVIAPTQ
jgi:4-amino-4-deoxy-L-arabinose transferase-like glycosyltransferase